MAIAPITLKGQIFDAVGDSGNIYRNKETGLIIKAHADGTFKSDINISSAELSNIAAMDTNKGVAGADKNVTVGTTTYHLVRTNPDDGTEHPIYTSVDANGDTATWSYVPAAGTVAAHYHSTTGLNVPATATEDITGTVHTDTFTLPGYGDTQFHRVDGDTIKSADNKIELSLNTANGDWVDGTNHITPGYAVIGAENNGDATILYKGQYITPVTANGHTTYYDEHGNKILEEKGITNVYTDLGNGADVQEATLVNIDTHTHAMDSFRLDPVYKLDASGNLTTEITAYQYTADGEKPQTIPLADGSIHSDFSATALEVHIASTKAENDEDHQQHVEQQNRDIALIVAGVLSAGFLSITAGLVGYKLQRDGFKKKIDGIMQDAYQAQIDRGVQPNSNNLSDITTTQIDKAQEDFTKGAGERLAMSGGFGAAAMAAFIVGLTVTAAPVALAFIVLAATIGGALIGGGAGYLGGKKLAETQSKPIVINAVNSEENKLGNTIRKELEVAKGQLNFERIMSTPKKNQTHVERLGRDRNADRQQSNLERLNAQRASRGSQGFDRA